MPDRFCICLYKTMIDEPVSTLSTVLEFLFSVVISIFGVLVNYKFRKKLQEERRNRPAGRKGNVIEPVMRWFCILQIMFWPWELLHIWIDFNEIVPSDQLPSWWCYIVFYTIKAGRMCVAYNSLFVAIIRYVYIVHQQRSNQWNFEKVGKWFQIASIAIPISMETIGVFTDPYSQYSNSSDRFKDCIVFYEGSNVTNNYEPPKPATVELTMHYLPDAFVMTIYYIYVAISMVVLFNITEAYLYFKIFRSIKR